MYLEEKLDLLLENQTLLDKKVDLFPPNLSTEKGVTHFLEITKNTFNNYMVGGVFIEGEHFEREGKAKVFIPDAIIKLKKSGIKGKRKISSKQNKLDAVNQQLGIISECSGAVKGFK